MEVTAMTIDIQEVIDIINVSELEDALILNTHYEQLLSDLEDSNEKVRIVILKRKAQKRIKVLTHG